MMFTLECRIECSNQGSTGAEGTSSNTTEENCEEYGKWEEACDECEEDFDCEKKLSNKTAIVRKLSKL